jgi:hypothetical protein
MLYGVLYTYECGYRYEETDYKIHPDLCNSLVNAVLERRKTWQKIPANRQDLEKIRHENS